MYCQPIRSVSAVERIAQKWDALSAHSGQANIFLTREWLMTWWKFSGQSDQLYLLTVNNQAGELVGLAPLMIRKKPGFGGAKIREVTFLGNDAACSEHLDFLSRSGQEQEVATAISAYLREHHADWDMLYLTDIPLHSITLETLRAQLANDHIWIDEEGASCPYLPISDSWDAYWDSKSGRTRRTFRYKRRRFEKRTGGRFVFCDSPQQVQEALSRLSELNPTRWQAKGEKSAFAQQTFQAFHQEIAQRLLAKGWLDLSYLEVHDQIAAVVYSFQYGNKIFYYNSAFDPQWSKYGLGYVLLGYCIERAFTKELEEYDFLRGLHSYKFEWTSLTRQNRNVSILRRSPKMRLWHEMQNRTRLAKDKAKEHLPLNVKQWLKRVV
ncbi:MAG: GNAT family N-acetyltransferase [Ardenticatenaceae bacterium]